MSSNEANGRQTIKKTSVSHKLKDNKKLVSRLLKINKLATELQKETSLEVLGDDIGVTRQSMHYQDRKEKNHE